MTITQEMLNALPFVRQTELQIDTPTGDRWCIHTDFDFGDGDLMCFYLGKGNVLTDLGSTLFHMATVASDDQIILDVVLERIVACSQIKHKKGVFFVKTNAENLKEDWRKMIEATLRITAFAF